MKTNASPAHSSAIEDDYRKPAPPGGDELDLREITRVIWRHKFIILGTMITVTLAVTTVLMMLTPMYSATAIVAVNAREQKIVDVESVLAGLPANAETVQTEIQVLQSRELADRVAAKLNLHSVPEFNSSLRPHAWYQLSIPPSWTHFWRATDAPDRASDTLSRQQSAETNVFLSKLDVIAIGQSRAISIDFKSEDPQIAAAAVNALADEYIDAQRRAKREATERANQWLESKLLALREKAEESQRSVETYRRQSGLLMSEKEVTLPTMEVSELSSQFAIAQAKRADVEAQLQQAQDAVRSSSGAGAVPEVLNSSLIQSLREQEATLMDKSAQLSSRYGSDYPDVATVRNQLETTRHTLSLEVNRVIDGLHNQLRAAQIREDTLRGRLQNLKQQLGTTNEAQGELQILQGEAAANQALYDTFLSRYKQTSADDSLQQPDAQLISRADIPKAPVFPNTKIMLAVSVVGSACLGLLLAFAREVLDDGVRSAEHIYTMGFRALGLVPNLRRTFRWRREPADLMADADSAFAESIRGVSVGVLLAGDGLPPKVILVASSMPSEGKTTLSVAWARLLAMGGKRVIVVDCDLRRPRVHKAVGGSASPGLVDCLTGASTVEQAIHKDSKSSADLLCAGTSTRDPSTLLGSERMKELLGKIAAHYDLIILDSAPVLAVSDARVLCQLVDRTVYLIRWGKTRRKAAANGLAQITEAGGEIAGVVLTLVDVKRHALYGFSDSGYFYGSLAKYYSS
jgi:polysaccharide biosynthesis transport protein